jgi:SP family xylose:H+ symportor-like MFS transporter
VQGGSRTYVVLVCMVAALGGLLFGYDTAVIAGAIGFLQSHFHLNAAMKGWAASSALLGCVIGVSFAGILSDHAGRRKTLLFSAFLFLGSAVGTALAGNFLQFVLARILGGVGIGIASMASPMYIAEITPARIRGRMVSVNQLAIISGMLMIYFVNYFIARQGDEAWNAASGWRWMFASGAVPSILFLVLLLGVPESPRWLVEQGLVERARRVLTRTGGQSFADRELSAIEGIVSREKDLAPDLLAPGVRPVLLIGVALAVLQQVTGINVFLYYAPEIFKRMGSGTNVALLQTIVVGAVNMLFTVIAIQTVDAVGRRPLMILGASGMGLSLVAMGIAAHHQAVSFWVLAFILSYMACFALSVGPVTWVILSEIFPTRIRGRALSVATFALWTSNFVVSQTFPMMDEQPWLASRFNHGFPFYLYALFCILLVWLVWKRIPETKGRSLEEIEAAWQGTLKK